MMHKINVISTHMPNDLRSVSKQVISVNLVKGLHLHKH